MLAPLAAVNVALLVLLSAVLLVAAQSPVDAGAETKLSAAKLRGVDPADVHLYEPDAQDQWRCLRSGETIAWRHVNDDYCDCQDGSDEPGTSACPNATFYCRNEGHIPAVLLSSRVNDGVCDEACCDGSDEWAGVVKCENRCDKVGRQYRKRKAEEENKRRAGSKIRAQYIRDAAKLLESSKAEVTRLEVEVQVAEEKERRLHAALQQAQNSDQELIQKKKESSIYATLTEHQTALGVLLNRESELKAAVQKLNQMLDELSGGYNPNYQDMAVKGVVTQYRRWKKGPMAEVLEPSGGEDGEAADGDAKGENERLKQLLDDAVFPSDRVRGIVDQDPLDLLDDGLFKGAARTAPSSKDSTGLLFRIQEYLPDALLPFFEMAVDAVLDLLLRANVITEVKRAYMSGIVGSDSAGKVGGGAEADNVAAARTAWNEAEGRLRTLRSDLEARRRDAEPEASNWGRDAEFKALDGKCVEKDMGEYTYELCFMQRATQKPNKGGMSVSLGLWARFDPANASLTPDDDGYYLRQLYDRGQRVWNAGDRTASVDLECGVRNELLDVFEAEVGKYSMRAATPAVCFETPAAAASADAEARVKQEL